MERMDDLPKLTQMLSGGARTPTWAIRLLCPRERVLFS